MSKADLHRRLNNAYEITFSVKGRKSGKNIPRPVWFVYEGNTLYTYYQFRALTAAGTKTCSRSNVEDFSSRASSSGNKLII